MNEMISISMKRSLAVMSLLCSILAIDAQPPWSAPAFYKGLQGPRYSVVRNGTGWELRTYESASWISTQRDAPELDLATGAVVDIGVQTLLNYTSGGNEAGAKLNMTVPVVTKMEAGPACDSTFTISFYLPDEYQISGDAPQPSDNSTFINNMPSMDLYVLSFDGVANSSDYEDRLLELCDLLEAANETYTVAWWFTAWYDSPDTLTDRHNEVWLPPAPVYATSVPAKRTETAVKTRAAPATKAAAPKLTSKISIPGAAKPPAFLGRKFYGL